MKYCPNLECPYLVINGMVAEYQDHLDVCPDCETELAEGEAPLLIPNSDAAENDTDDLLSESLSSVCRVDSYKDALWLKNELEQVGIPAIVRVTENIDETLPEDSSAGLDNPDLPTEEAEPLVEDMAMPTADSELESISTFDVKVMDRHMLAAMDLVRTLLDEEDELDDDEDLFEEGFDDELNLADHNGASHVVRDDQDAPLVEPGFVTNPWIILVSFVCILLAIAYLLLVGFPKGL